MNINEREDEPVNPLESPGRPLCPQCTAPADPFAYYCRRCGYATGQFTPYLPFINIRHNYAGFGTLWRRVWHEKTSVPMKVVCFTMILFLAPEMFLAVPFILWRKYGRPFIMGPILQGVGLIHGVVCLVLMYGRILGVVVGVMMLIVAAAFFVGGCMVTAVEKSKPHTHNTKHPPGGGERD